MLQRIKNKMIIFLVIFLIFSYPCFAAVVDTFNVGDTTLSLLFPNGDETQTYFITVPDGTVLNARMRLIGLDVEGETLVPADAVVVTDVSGSMGTTKLNAAIDADIAFVNTLLPDDSTTDSRIGLVSYTTSVDSTYPLTGIEGKSDLIDEIYSYDDKYMTCISCGISEAIQILQDDWVPDITHAMLVMSDGVANYCIPGVDCSDNVAREEAVVEGWKARQQGIDVYTVGFGGGADETTLERIACWNCLDESHCGPGEGSWMGDVELGDGTWVDCRDARYRFAADVGDIIDIYEEIARTISAQFFSTPTISSTNPLAKDGWWTNPPTEYKEDTMWNNGVCSGAGVSCIDYRDFIQQNLDVCAADPCDISFSVYSETAGRLDLSELYIEIQTQECGNGIPEPGEECDDGANGDDTDQCYDDCTLTYCGDRIIQNPNGEGEDGPLNDGNEDCDDGNIVNDDRCDTNCVFTFCGDGIRQTPNGEGTGGPFDDGDEECDDGNLDNADECTNDCIANPPPVTFCGDGITQKPNDAGTGGPLNDGFEDCDDENLDDTDTCFSDCVFTFCGDSIRQTPNGEGTGGPLNDGNEECDDGDDDDTDECSNNCIANPGGTFCGDGDTQKPNDAGTGGPLGDGFEDCDDGNDDDTDICNSNCEYTYCRDGTVQSPNGKGEDGPLDDGYEECDDGNFNDDDLCTTECVTTYCGDGIQQAPNGDDFDEECDDGNLDECDGCSSTCQSEVCGNNRIDCGEECDDGNLDECDGCSSTCQTEICGNNRKECDEECDDGSNDDPYDLCHNDCTNTECGDGYTQSPNGEGTGGPGNDGFEQCDGEFYCTGSCIVDYGANCNDCTACFDAGGNPFHPGYLTLYECLVGEGCLDEQISVFNTPASLQPLDDLSDLFDPNDVVVSFESLDDALFSIDPFSGFVTNTYTIDGKDTLHGTVSAAIIEIRIDASGELIRFCPKLKRFNFNVGSGPEEIDADLLVTGSRSVVGYFEEGGYIYSTGPYIFTAKVWLRE